MRPLLVACLHVRTRSASPWRTRSRNPSSSPRSEAASVLRATLGIVARLRFPGPAVALPDTALPLAPRQPLRGNRSAVASLRLAKRSGVRGSAPAVGCGRGDVLARCGRASIARSHLPCSIERAAACRRKAGVQAGPGSMSVSRAQSRQVGRPENGPRVSVKVRRMVPAGGASLSGSYTSSGGLLRAASACLHFVPQWRSETPTTVQLCS